VGKEFIDLKYKEKQQTTETGRKFRPKKSKQNKTKGPKRTKNTITPLKPEHLPRY
jgi:hypothetical protein